MKEMVQEEAILKREIKTGPSKKTEIEKLITCMTINVKEK